ncbi:MAG: GNAT family N-acetyltransferase [bacterium]|nr:GNAT family N-acetyltransferase [bacterium]
MRNVDAFDALAATPAGASSVVITTRRVDVDDAELVHALYLATPSYFDVISIPVPSMAEVRTEIAAAQGDERRHIELVLADPEPRWPGLTQDPRSGRLIVGYLDYKLDYPEPGDATVNLLLIHGAVQSLGLGGRVVPDLERRLKGAARRVLASIYGRNPSARRFWERLGYSFAMDARPVLEWYAKELQP